MSVYNIALQGWAAKPRSPQADDDLLAHMRAAYRQSWPRWHGVWTVINAIRAATNISDDGFAFINLALCHEPEGSDDNEAIVKCQESFPIDNVVKALDARVIFFAKGGAVGRAVNISGEGTTRFVLRYGNGSRGNLNGDHWGKWVPRDAAKLRQIIEDAR